MIDLRAAALIAVCAGVTMLLRFLPFLVFGGKKEVPGYITYLSGVLPYAIMGMLVVYCLKNMNLFAGPHGIPEFWRLLLLSDSMSGNGIRCSASRLGQCSICFWSRWYFKRSYTACGIKKFMI